MPTSQDLVALGTPPEVAKRIGFNGSSRKLAAPLTAIGTAQVGAAVIRKDATWVQLTTSGGQTAAILPSDAEYMVPYVVFVVAGGTTGLIFPPSGAAINAVADNASVNCAAELPRLFYRVQPLLWFSLLAA